MEDKQILTEREAAEWLKVSCSWLRAHRAAGTGPAWIDIGSGERAIPRYKVADLAAWLDSRRVGGGDDTQ